MSKSLLRVLWVLSLVTISASVSAAQIKWDGQYWNRHALKDDFIIPLPCGGAMAFRRITIKSAKNWMSDHQIKLGSTDQTFAYAEFLRTAHISGSLSASGRNTERFYYLGKYEVSDSQYKAVMSDKCAEPDIEGSLPMSHASWFDAIEFTRSLTEWLAKNAAKALPVEDGARAYIRLPTEAEWEFAARGGMLPEAQFRADLFPMQNGAIDQYIWYAGPGSCDGDVQPIGLKDASPNGLHDILGNVQEIVLEPFRMNRAGRLHGQVGGYIAKGGSCSTNKSLLRTSLRTEIPYFDGKTAQVSRTPFTGFRVIIAAPALTSHKRLEAYRQDWQKIQGLRTANKLSASPVQALEQMADNTTNIETRNSLKAIAADFRREMSERNDVDARAARSAIIAATQVIRTYRTDNRTLASLQKLMPECTGAGTCEILKPKLETAKLRLQTTASVYIDLLTQTENDYAQSLLEEQSKVVIEQYRKLHKKIPEFVRKFVQQVGAYRSKPTTDFKPLLQQLL